MEVAQRGVSFGVLGEAELTHVNGHRIRRERIRLRYFFGSCGLSPGGWSGTRLVVAGGLLGVLLGVKDARSSFSGDDLGRCGGEGRGLISSSREPTSEPAERH